MSQADVTPREALLRLGASTAEAVARVLETFLPGGVNRGDVTALADGTNPLRELTTGALVAAVSYVDGVTGANVFVMDPRGARALAGAMGVPAPEDYDSDDSDTVIELSELEISAVAEASNQTMAAAAGAISVVLGQDVEISPPDTFVISVPGEAAERFGSAPHAVATTFTLSGETCRLIQLVPSAFVMRMARAIDEQSEPSSHEAFDIVDDDDALASSETEHSAGVCETLNQIHLRVWAELGRTRLPLGAALSLPVGSVLDLDCAADAPVDLFVNGLRFAQGHLLVTDDGEWAVHLATIGGHGSESRTPVGAHTPSKGAVT